MFKDLGVQTYIYPQPVLIVGTYDENGKADAMNAAWGGTGAPNQVVMCLTHSHATCQNFEKTGAFTVSIPGADQVLAADFVGIVSAKKDPDKIAKTGWTVQKSEHVNAPLFPELPLSLECKFAGYDEAGRTVGEVVNVVADERILDADGNVDVAKLNPITYDPSGHGYYVLGEKVGDAFHDGAQLK